MPPILSNALGVSVLICKNLAFILLDLHLDPEGKFVGIHAVIANVPPLASLSLLAKVTQIIATLYQNIVLTGDFNMTPCPHLDKLTLDTAVDSPLSRWASTFGFTDIWRLKYPLLRSYTNRSYLCQQPCSSQSTKGLYTTKRDI